MDVHADLLQIRRLTHADLQTCRSLVQLFNRVFEQEELGIRSEAGLSSLLDNPAFVAVAAFLEHELVGGLTAYELAPYHYEIPEIFLYDLAVTPAHQRRGIGRRLLQFLHEYCGTRGIREFFVLAHEEDHHAREFYRVAGGSAEKVVNFIFNVNGSNH